MFEGVAGRAAAKVMARSNRDAELEAIDILDPGHDDCVVAIGIGPGVGVHALSTRVRSVLGVDPSHVMIEEARRRCSSGIRAGIVELAVSNAARIPLPDESAHGAIAVNSVQLWAPFDSSVAEVARVLRPNGRLVTLTHDWAIRRSRETDIDRWVDVATETCARYGLVDPACYRARAEHSRAVVFTVRRT